MKEVFALIFLIVSITYLVIGLPKLGYYTIMLAQRRRLDIGPSWHDMWGLNLANLIFFPSLLDDDGKKYQRLAVGSAARTTVGIVTGIAAFYLSGKFS